MLVAVCSVKGSPGVTTFATALAARWPHPARSVLVESDPSGGDVAMRFSLASSPGLVSMVAAARRYAEPGLLWQHTQVLPGGLPVVVAPPGAEQARAALQTLAAEGSAEVGALRNAAIAPDALVIADCGRVDPGSPAIPVVRSADVMVLLSRAHADDVAHLAMRLGTVGRWSRRPVLVLAGPGYPSAAIERELGVPVTARIPDDRRGAAALCGRGSGRGPSRSALGRIAARLATLLAGPPPATISRPDRLNGAATHSTPSTWEPRELALRNGARS